MSKIGEFILRNLSRPPGSEDYMAESYEQKHREINTYIEVLEQTFPDLTKWVFNQKVLNIGCGNGMEALALSMMGACEVYGIDIRVDSKRVEEIQKEYPGRNFKLAVMDAHAIEFPDETFDAILTCGSFEHFAHPNLVMKEMARVLRKGEVIFATSGVWAHPWGSHMNFFTKVPWLQYLFSEKTIMNVRSLYRKDGAKRFSEVEGGLNKIGVREFIRIAKESNLKVEYLRLNPIKNLTFLTGIPLIQELFTSLIVGVLKK